MLVRPALKMCGKATYIYGSNVIWRGAIGLSGRAVLSGAGEKAVEGVGCCVNCKVDIVCHP